MATLTKQTSTAESKGSATLPLPEDTSSGLQHIEDCTHELIEEGSCIECGLAMTGSGSHMQREEEYSTSHQRAAAVSTMGFEKDLEGKDLPAEIKAWVLKMAAAAQKETLRMNSRAVRLFAYVYLAYLTLEYPMEPEKLVAILNIDKALLPEALRLASGIGPKPLPQSRNAAITAPMVVIPPNSYLNKVLPVLKMEAYKATIEALIDKAIARDPLLLEEKPEWMAIAFVKYYLDSSGYTVPKFHDHFKMTASSVKGCVAKIEAALRE